nr:uncharacterized protein LOC127329678 [Lolium perenne]
MSSPPPTTTSSAPPPVPSAAATTAGSPAAATTAGSAAPAPVIYTPEQMSGVVNDLVTAVQGIRLYLIGSRGPPTPPRPAIFSVPTPAPGVPPFHGRSAASLRRRRPSPGRNGHRPPPPAQAPRSSGASPSTGSASPSPSPLPAWLTASSTQPVYTTAAEPPMPSLPGTAPGGYARPYEARPDAHGPGGVTQPPPRYTKVDFATYDGSEDPLNWLSQCEQFFRGQRTLTSDRTGLPPYHLRAPPGRGTTPSSKTRAACLPGTIFGSYASFASALACHAPGVTGQQRTELFVGGLPDHIRVDVELQAPHDLQTAMHYARAYERRAQALQPPPRVAGPGHPPAPAGRSAGHAASTGRSRSDAAYLSAPHPSGAVGAPTPRPVL